MSIPEGFNDQHIHADLNLPGFQNLNKMALCDTEDERLWSTHPLNVELFLKTRTECHKPETHIAESLFTKLLALFSDENLEHEMKSHRIIELTIDIQKLVKLFI